MDRYCLRLVLALAFVILLKGDDVALAERRLDVSDQPLAIVPVVTIEQSDSMEVDFVLYNRWDRRIRYIAGGANPNDARYILYDANGRVVHPDHVVSYGPVTEQAIRTLRPGESAAFTLQLSNWWFDLKTGLYALEVRMKVSQPMLERHGVAEVDLRQRVVYVKVVESAASSRRTKSVEESSTKPTINDQ